MKVTDLKENECIHCETEEQAIAICKLMHEAGLEWQDGNSYLEEIGYHIYASRTCYFAIEGTFSDLDYAKDSNYKIYKAEQFLFAFITLSGIFVSLCKFTRKKSFPWYLFKRLIILLAFFLLGKVVGKILVKAINPLKFFQ